MLPAVVSFGNGWFHQKFGVLFFAGMAVVFDDFANPVAPVLFIVEPGLFMLPVAVFFLMLLATDNIGSRCVPFKRAVGGSA